MKAFKELDLPNSELVFVGNINPEFRSILKEYSSIPNIRFIKNQKQKDLKFYYNKAHLFVQCSIEEGLSMVQAQAMACGLPVICTENTGGSEIVDNNINGFIIPIRNVEILKIKIKKLYNDREKLKRMSKNAFLKAKQKLSWESYGNKMIKKYKELL